MTVEQLNAFERQGKCQRISSWCLGYTSRRAGETACEPYKGRYGSGYVTYQPSWQSTRYCIKNYYILGEAK